MTSINYSGEWNDPPKKREPQGARQVVQCPRRHYYDAQKYAQCPHCQKKEKDSPQRGEDTPTQRMGQGGDSQGAGKWICKTPFSDGTDFDKGNTIHIHGSERGNNFLTGWLVCVEGPEKGRDYRIYYGVNRIGRDQKNDICIQEDRAISRECQCSVVYEDRENVFYAVPQSGGMIYLNEKMLEVPERLHTGDKLTIGGSQFLFIAFCEGDRKW